MKTAAIFIFGIFMLVLGNYLAADRSFWVVVPFAIVFGVCISVGMQRIMGRRRARNGAG